LLLQGQATKLAWSSDLQINDCMFTFKLYFPFFMSL
jgi:hypothetical protein